MEYTDADTSAGSPELELPEERDVEDGDEPSAVGSWVHGALLEAEDSELTPGDRDFLATLHSMALSMRTVLEQSAPSGAGTSGGAGLRPVPGPAAAVIAVGRARDTSPSSTSDGVGSTAHAGGQGTATASAGGGGGISGTSAHSASGSSRGASVLPPPVPPRASPVTMVSTLCGNEEEDTLGDPEALEDMEVQVEVGARGVGGGPPAVTVTVGLGGGGGAGVSCLVDPPVSAAAPAAVPATVVPVGRVPARATTATAGVYAATFGASSRPTATLSSSTATTSTQCGTDDDGDGQDHDTVWVTHEGGGAGNDSGGAPVTTVSFGTQWDGSDGEGAGSDGEVKAAPGPYLDSDHGDRPPGVGYRFFSAVDEDALGDEVDALGAAFSCLADAESLFETV